MSKSAGKSSTQNRILKPLRYCPISKKKMVPIDRKSKLFNKNLFLQTAQSKLKAYFNLLKLVNSENVSRQLVNNGADVFFSNIKKWSKMYCNGPKLVTYPQKMSISPLGSPYNVLIKYMNMFELDKLWALNLSKRGFNHVFFNTYI